MHVAAIQENIVLDIRKLVGDRTGLLHIHSTQKFVVEYVESLKNAFVSGVNFKIDVGGEIILPSVVHVYGEGVKLRTSPEYRSLDLDGRLTGISDMSVSRGTSFYVGGEAHTALLNNGSYLYIDDPGQFRFGTLDLKSKSVMKVAPEGLMTGLVGYMDMRFEAELQAEQVKLKASTLNIEAGAAITTSAGDRPYDTLDDSDGVGVNGSISTGGGHASRGGWATSGATTEEGGAYYGTLYTPDQRGARGGQGTSGTSGKGGGTIKVEAATELFIDGYIKVNGGDSSGDSGAGSGGSVWVISGGVEGHGEFQAIGGSGAAGGSGGRIALYVKQQNQFVGTYESVGGSGTRGSMSSGGPGSAYIEDIRYTRPYTTLRLDNNNFNWDQYYVIDEAGKNDYDFHELHLNRDASLHLRADSTQRSLNVAKVYGDRTGRVHMRENNKVIIEQSATSATVMKAPVNVWIDDGAQAYLATLVYVLGNGAVAFRWNGELIGVRHLRVMPARVMTVGFSAMTSTLVNGQYTKGKEGEFVFSSFELGSGCAIDFPAPMGAKMTMALMVRLS